MRPILVGGAVVGILDMIPAFISFGLKAPQGVAAGLLGPSIAFQGGAITWIFGMLLHFFIAFTAATIYCIVGRKLEFLAIYWVVCGLFYGTAVFLFMNLIVLPLSALHMAGPFGFRALITGILGNMVEVGLPISFSLHKFGKTTHIEELRRMDTSADSVLHAQSNLLRPILIGGAIAGSLDKTWGFISFGLKSAQGIAAGLVGRSIAFQGGAATWTLGMLLHFLIAFTAATIYCLASRKLKFLADHWLVCGLFFGMAVFLVMNLVVLPLSALQLAGPYQLRGLIIGIMGHMIIVGLPISFSLHKFAKKP
jgi:uncharacterized membrane protein YagU involved in acid resistance